MAENPRPPVAVRTVRPYDTEEAFLESELETVGKTSVILIGAHTRPQGVILRFEVTLQSGAVVLRGEGRVLQYKESAFRGQPGLALRFTRLDPKSKALVDRAAAIREARLAGSMPPAPPPAPPTPEPISVPVSQTLSEPVPESVELSSSDLEPESEPPPVDPRPAQSEPPSAATAKPPPLVPTSMPPAEATIPPDPLVAMPSFAPMGAMPSASSLPSSMPANHTATIAPDGMLASLLTAPTPVPPPAEEVAAMAAPATTAAATPARAEPSKDVNNAVTRIADRDALLARLRERRARMTDAETDDILRSR